jgi:hypothetical protein
MSLRKNIEAAARRYDYSKIKAELERVELMILVYGNELGDSVRVQELEQRCNRLNQELLDIMNQDNTV